MLKYLLFLGTLALGHSSNIDCGRVPPSLWCQNKDLAAQCNVSQQCNEYTTKSKGQKLRLTLLYESLCPYCERFIIGTFYTDIYLKYADKVEFELVPYGNAKIGKNGQVLCQHGTPECAGNKYEACVIHYFEDPIPFVRCLEQQLPQTDIVKAATKCYATFKTSADLAARVTTCYNTDLADQLHRAHGARTDAIGPEKKYGVPWLLFNNVSLGSAQKYGDSFKYAIDDWYIPNENDAKLVSEIAKKTSELKLCRDEN
ncbi:unnamed protein product [Bursaphelenchus xylophilus]|uniref:(pine wood nematode) hypothetical protein n=1 Tax=Bursaphelenchus xylophilus TaxID=6326 RepID=A0A1I7RWD3_BURXY|nr:unnamed protein product [Bursaphelenchus xylophilus]CAG9095491.1 unnamed protein product [Bursaphelenchus xylophilus]